MLWFEEPFACFITYIIIVNVSLDYMKAQTVAITIPANAKTSNTIIRWRQLYHGGTSYDKWAIDNVQLMDNTTTIKDPNVEIILFSDNFDTTSVVPYEAYLYSYVFLDYLLIWCCVL